MNSKSTNAKLSGNDSAGPGTGVFYGHERLKLRQTGRTKPKAKSQLTVRTPEEILKLEFDPNDLYLENGIFAKGQPLTFLGPGGLGKTRLALQFAICTIIGQDFLGMEVKAKELKWLVLQTENSNRRLKKDFAALKTWVGEDRWKLVEEKLRIQTVETAAHSSLALNEQPNFQNVALLVAEHQPDVILVDPLEAVACGSLNTDAGMKKTVHTLLALTQVQVKQAALVILHHTLTGKAGAAKATGIERGSYGRGSKALNSWTRGQINLAHGTHDSSGELIVVCGKNSNGPDFDPFGIWLNEETMLYEVDPDFDIEQWRQQALGKSSGRATFTPEHVRGLVEETPLSKEELRAAIISATGRKKSTAYNLINSSVAAKVIALDAGGRYVAV